MKVSTELEIALSLASHEAHRRRHDLMTVEHLLFALLHDAGTARIVTRAGGDVEGLKRFLDRYLTRELVAVPDEQPVTPVPSRGFRRVLQRAAFHVQSSGREELAGEHVLVAIFSEPDSVAVAALANAGVTRYDVVAYLSHGVTKGGEPDEVTDDGGEDVSTAAEASEDAASPIRSPASRRTSTNGPPPGRSNPSSDANASCGGQSRSWRDDARTTPFSSATPGLARPPSSGVWRRGSKRARCRTS
jgi:ATP-dependent Clp protease ATP-binding subunit ClpA